METATESKALAKPMTRITEASWLVRGAEAMDYIGLERWVYAELECGHVYVGTGPGPAFEHPSDLDGAVVRCGDCVMEMGVAA